MLPISPRRWGLPALALATVACGDLSTIPKSTPSRVEIDRTLVTTTEGSDVEFTTLVYDQNDRPMNVPAWAQPVWSVASPEILEPKSRGVRALGPGKSTATVKVAGLEKEVTVRVNPQQLKLSVAAVSVTQAGNTRAHLVPDRAANVAVFLTADKPNFFRPRVLVSIWRNGALVHRDSAVRNAESIPQSYNASDASSAWVAEVPASVMQPGVSITVDADPERQIGRSSGSVDKFPQTGSMALDVRLPTLQVRIRHVQLNQSVQTLDGSVPLVAGRDAFLRVFVTGDEASELTTAIRATFYSASGNVVHQVRIDGAVAVPTQVVEQELDASWNARIPASVLSPGTSIVVEVDPAGRFTYKDGSVPRYPASGVASLNLRSVPKLWLRMVPIYQTAFQTMGDISAENVDGYMAALTSKFGISTTDVAFRGPLFTGARTNTSSGWSQVLSEVNALRIADGSTRYYYGVLRLAAGSPNSGIGYLGGRASVGYDQVPRSHETFAHELGHNFSLYHAPCGNPAGVDPAFPYPTGSIGVLGYDMRSGELRLPSAYKDLMTYCGPEWISDYSFRRALEFRDRWDWTTTGADASEREESLLIWGRVHENRLILEPTFQLSMPERMPNGTGEYRLEGLDAQGRLLFSWRFDPLRTDHDAGSSFGFSVPTRLAHMSQLAAIRVVGPEGEAVRRRGATEDAVVRIDETGGRSALSWDSSYEMALVRDARTGEIISFARGGTLQIPSRAVEVMLSDGVRSVRAGVERRKR
jgi:hypothetical protein